mmetsp:Transcript_52209/g.62868  ORF Transcript_52209/g.62868 Transcript_52209/m.62868 type:complete len:479 (-) Transcript_52209:357-1793(-)|eukprot:CAMPEP_0172518158 /NCGR_PEP_ID=MMETSP1066-20121228/290643_1 /TAXON_ID=671091 /ORGANISM="Coscinodiscus wailesii, Strain CCMP2513" /LENGTH=478 /DNA_ID=CAMNT_0013300487 /DNA_START=230 /DNA_END=1666 /DNA_ORIENTATION=-
MSEPPGDNEGKENTSTSNHNESATLIDNNMNERKKMNETTENLEEKESGDRRENVDDGPKMSNAEKDDNEEVPKIDKNEEKACTSSLSCSNKSMNDNDNGAKIEKIQMNEPTSDDDASSENDNKYGGTTSNRKEQQPSPTIIPDEPSSIITAIPLSLSEQKQQLLQQNKVLQHRISFLLSSREGSNSRILPIKSDNTSDSNVSNSGGATATTATEKYQNLLKTVSETNTTLHSQNLSHDELTERLATDLSEKERRAATILDTFLKFQKSIAVDGVELGSKLKRDSYRKRWHELTERERERDAVIKKERIVGIGLRLELSSLERLSRSRERIAEGVSLSDYESLLVDNKSLKLSLKEKQREMKILREKGEVNCHVLAHVVEKLHFLRHRGVNLKNDDDGENAMTLEEWDEVLMKDRMELRRLKKMKEMLKNEVVALQQNNAVADNQMLVNDYWQTDDTIHRMRSHLAELQRRHRELTTH